MSTRIPYMVVFIVIHSILPFGELKYSHFHNIWQKTGKKNEETATDLVRLISSCRESNVT